MANSGQWNFQAEISIIISFHLYNDVASKAIAMAMATSEASNPSPLQARVNRVGITFVYTQSNAFIDAYSICLDIQ